MTTELKSEINIFHRAYRFGNQGGGFGGGGWESNFQNVIKSLYDNNCSLGHGGGGYPGGQGGFGGSSASAAGIFELFSKVPWKTNLIIFCSCIASAQSISSGGGFGGGHQGGFGGGNQGGFGGGNQGGFGGGGHGKKCFVKSFTLWTIIKVQFRKYKHRVLSEFPSLSFN